MWTTVSDCIPFSIYRTSLRFIRVVKQTAPSIPTRPSSTVSRATWPMCATLNASLLQTLMLDAPSPTRIPTALAPVSTRLVAALWPSFATIAVSRCGRSPAMTFLRTFSAALPTRRFGVRPRHSGARRHATSTQTSLPKQSFSTPTSVVAGPKATLPLQAAVLVLHPLSRMAPTSTVRGSLHPALDPC